MLPILEKLLSSSENWYDIKEQDDYQYPGKFSEVNPIDVWDTHQIFPLYHSIPKKISIFFLITYKLARRATHIQSLQGIHQMTQVKLHDDEDKFDWAHSI